MAITDIVKGYFQGLEAGSYEQVIQLFHKDAIIHSPLYGKINAQSFYKELFSATNKSKITLKNIFININNPKSAAAQFLYDWTLLDGTSTYFECIDIFDFSEEMKILELKIIYDTYRVRGAFESATAKE